MPPTGDIRTRFELAPTLAALPGQPRASIDRLASLGFRHVQLSATQPSLRPRELDTSARRDLIATLRRRELSLSGLDLWIPALHFSDSAHVDRAVSAAITGIELAGDLGRCPVSITLPAERGDEAGDQDGASIVTDALRTIFAAAHQHGVPVADHQVPIVERPWDEIIGIGIDPAAWLAAGHNPSDIVQQHGATIISARASDLLTTGLRGPIGSRDGRLDVMTYQVALSIAEYQRPVVLDARQWLNPWAEIEIAASHWRSITP